MLSLQIAKVLQNLANGVAFGIKETYMQPCNAWMHRNEDQMAAYYDALCNVPEVAIALPVFLYLIMCCRLVFKVLQTLIV
jgi:hypothetical protein